MLHKTSTGPVWVSEQAPYYRDYLGKQLYKQRYAGRRRKPVVERTV
jgi:hypothetical protein